MQMNKNKGSESAEKEQVNTTVINMTYAQNKAVNECCERFERMRKFENGGL